jgi:hypothetical protein
MKKRWKAALDRAHGKWATASPDERRAITAELDALWDELNPGSSSVPEEPEPGPRHASARAILVALRIV